ncbi:MAG: ferritin-like domain-containing protein [Acidimicrobiia bacterium]
MIRLRPRPLDTRADLQAALQMAIQLELSTLPPYLYALYTLRPVANEPVRTRISAIVREEMTHMALAANILNAIGGTPVLADAAVVPVYPGPLPFDIGGDGDGPLTVSLLPFGTAAMDQAMRIEEPEDPIEFPSVAAFPATFQTIGQFYAALDGALTALPPTAWAVPPRNQLGDHPFFPGELFPVAGAADASKAIERIVSEGEGTPKTPLDFEGEVSHYYRFEEIRRDQLLEKDSSVPQGFRWGEPLGVDWDAVLPAIADPGEHDFSSDPPTQAAQDACDRAFTVMLEDLQRALNGEAGRLGNAVRAMFDLTMAARAALAVPLEGSEKVAGPAFRFRPELV